MREENQLKIIFKILDQYNGKEPFSRYLKIFFKTHPQMGSRDRRLAASFCYNWFRLGKALNDLRPAERLTIGNFLCSDEPNALLKYCIEKYSLFSEADFALSHSEKINLIHHQHPAFSLEKIFPFTEHLSAEINKQEFIQSFLHQPGLWIRIRKNFLTEVLDEFRTKEINFQRDEINPLAVCLKNATSLEKTDSFQKGLFEIQDWASQQTIRFIEPAENENWWDACAGSGGKSLMMLDAMPALTIIATDRRESILRNLEQRFQRTGIQNIETAAVDVSLPASLVNLQSKFQGSPFSILADVPCSGSGTWARTPERQTSFKEAEIADYVTHQRKIVSNLTQFLKQGAAFSYITCSVFKEENEENVAWIQSNTGLFLHRSGYIKGYEKKADTLYAALFTRL